MSNEIDRIIYKNGRYIAISVIENPDPPQDIVRLDLDGDIVDMSLDEAADVAKLCLDVLARFARTVTSWMVDDEC